jgi:cell division cycle 2-like protein
LNLKDESNNTETSHSVDTDQEDHDRTPDHRSDRSESQDNSERDELDEKMEEYYKKISSKKPLSQKQEELYQMETDVKEAVIDEQKSENIILPPPPPETITYFCATQGSRSVEEFECLNKIEEGAYGVVFRAKDKKSSNLISYEIIFLKHLRFRSSFFL